MAAYRGRTVVMTFVYSTCEDTCPAQVQSIRGALDRLGRDVPVLAVSVDPRNDTPARARRFLLEQHMTGRVRFVLGSRARARAGVARLRDRARSAASSTTPPTSCWSTARAASASASRTRG